VGENEGAAVIMRVVGKTNIKGLLMSKPTASTSKGGGYKFKQAVTQLPNCPPADAFNKSEVVLRLIEGKSAQAKDFRSGAEEGRKQPKKCDDCRWQACSVWEADTPLENIAGLTRLPKLQHLKYIAHVQLVPSAGQLKLHEDSEKHYSFWMCSTFDPVKAVIKTEPLT